MSDKFQTLADANLAVLRSRYTPKVGQCRECPWKLPYDSKKRRGLVTGCMTYWEKENFTFQHPTGHNCHVTENPHLYNEPHQRGGLPPIVKCAGHQAHLQQLHARFAVAEGAD